MRTVWESEGTVLRIRAHGFTRARKTNKNEKNKKKQLTAVQLVRLVLAVGVAVALPRQPHALPVGAAELAGRAVGAAMRGSASLAAAAAAAAGGALVGAVSAVGVPVAAPHERHALGGVAAQVVRPARHLGHALELVAAVAAVVVPVAHVHARQALAVAAHELAAGAGLGVWV